MVYAIAVSGGVDSIVLLDMLVNGNIDGYDIVDPHRQIVVAHFDHGIRLNSADDELFVRGVAEQHGLAYETKREELGVNTSEEKARNHRYTFLQQIARKYNASLVTAHHADDVIETVAINLARGTGWRGLAVMDNPGILRPLLGMTKKDIIQYAKERNLTWREDSTNQDEKYLRNKLRNKIASLDEKNRRLLLELREFQVKLKQQIDNETDRLIGLSQYERYFFIHVPEETGLELLRRVMIRHTGQSPTRPVLQQILYAIKVFHGGKRFDVQSNVWIVFTNTHFVVEVSEKMVKYNQ